MATHYILGIVIVLYLAMMILIGVVFSKGNDDAGDFYLGGRKLGPLVTAMSAEASDMSSWLLLGIPGLAYLTGMADATWTIIGLAIGTYLNWLFVAARLRKYTEKIGAITIPEYFAARYKDEKNIITLISAVVIVIFFIPYVASGFAACPPAPRCRPWRRRLPHGSAPRRRRCRPAYPSASARRRSA